MNIRKKLLFVIALILLLSIFLGSCMQLRIILPNRDAEDNDSESEKNTEENIDSNLESISEKDSETESETESEAESETESESETEYVPPVIYNFHDYLEHEGVDIYWSISDLEKYLYEGKTLDDVCTDVIADGVGGGSQFGFCDFCGYEMSSYAKWNYNLTTKELYTKLPLENLETPYGITFEDDLPTALVKIGVDEDVIDNFVSDEGNDGVMTLNGNANSYLTLTDREKLSESNFEYRYELRYTEKYFSDIKNRTLDVVRYVSIQFEDASSSIGMFTLYLEYRYDNEYDAFEGTLDYEGFDEEIFGNEREVLSHYTYEEKTMEEMYGDWVLDDSDGTRYYINGEHFGAEIASKLNDNRVTNSVRFYAKDLYKIDWFMTPLYQASPNSTLQGILFSLGIADIKIPKDLDFDEDNPGVMLLYDGDVTVVLIDYLLIPNAEEDPEYRYKIVYTQTYDGEYGGVYKTITRKVEYSFKDENTGLGCLTYYIEETYENTTNI